MKLERDVTGMEEEAPRFLVSTNSAIQGEVAIGSVSDYGEAMTGSLRSQLMGYACGGFEAQERKAVATDALAFEVHLGDCLSASWAAFCTQFSVLPGYLELVFPSLVSGWSIYL